MGKTYSFAHGWRGFLLSVTKPNRTQSPLYIMNSGVHAFVYFAKQLALLKQQPDRLPKNVTAGQQAMTNLCQVLLSSNEFLYVD